MTHVADTDQVHAAPRRAVRLRWWREVIYVAAFYGVYSWIRNQFGSAAVSASTALGHALDVIQIERWVGLFHEETLQEMVLGFHSYIVFWNIYYGTFHFVVTAFALDLDVPVVPEALPPVAQHPGLHDGLRADRVRLVPADAAPAAAHLVRVRRHPRRVRRALVVRLGRDAEDLEPVRGDALAALRVGAVVHARDVAAGALVVGQGARWSPTRSQPCTAS